MNKTTVSCHSLKQYSLTCVTDGGAKRRLQANSEAKRNLIDWADNSQMNAEVSRKFSHEKKSLSRVLIFFVMSGSASDNKKERKAVTLGDGSGMEARSTQWLPPLSVLTE
ncbi:hypothetical protein T4C_13934 [Trichinella pseudospiralis]|uniref:Uncharacterized protein n=1 Tax=Trichinella pseudospiralis TaxID=6337 RepID=A0A0V1JWD2_TRIPS|nr:hypothetical protein T4C_13934 [Trichinella pseudospiralis]